MKKVLILLNMGGPNNLGEVEVFLKNMFNDPFILGVKSDFWRSVLAALIVKSRTASARSNYEKLGGRSPICSITEALCEQVNLLARAKYGAGLKFENADGAQNLKFQSAAKFQNEVEFQGATKFNSPDFSATCKLQNSAKFQEGGEPGGEAKFQNQTEFTSAAGEPAQEAQSEPAQDTLLQNQPPQSVPTQGEALQNEAPKNEKPIDELICDYAMNYTPPFAEDVFKKYADFDEIILMPLYPHFSKTTVQSSLCSAEAALKRLGIKNYKIIDIFYESAAYNEILLNLIADCVSKFSADEISQISLIFSAHSLPVKMVAAGDPYEAQVKAHVEILKDLLAARGIKFKEIILAYQSRLGPVKWLEPNVADVLRDLQSKKVLIFPIAFCVDNSETDFELDIFYRARARELGYEYYEVCKCPDSREDFAKFILAQAL
ncbi:ferrochelatase [uncultured Campylobacter sp.]|uniref:ferrochelatase n=1 Tax=uncultured Campylobacter sp. TaxID=218934 RepID=UPI002627E432|nr:ferrochelatase [uncultured Campylobacter sp.]